MFKAYIPFHDGPPVVLPALTRRRLIIYFLALGLTRVRYKEVACLFVKGKTPRVAEAQRPDFVTVLVNRLIRVGNGNLVR